MAEEQRFRIVPITREVFQQARVPLDEMTLKGLQTRDDVWNLTHRLMEEAALYLDIVGVEVYDADERPVTYKRDGAVLVGQFIRVRKLVRSFVRLIAAGEGYGAKVLERLINESVV